MGLKISIFENRKQLAFRNAGGRQVGGMCHLVSVSTKGKSDFTSESLALGILSLTGEERYEATQTDLQAVAVTSC